jgi:lysophospholipase L1-like esterase
MKISIRARYAEWHLDTPFWRSKRMYGESLFFIREPNAKYACARLLFPPNGEVELRSASQEIQYKPGIDYSTDLELGIVSLLPDSKIPFTDIKKLYCNRGQEHAIAHKRDNENVWLYLGEGHYFHDLQIEVSYRHDSKWQYYIPEYQGNTLSRTIAKLQNQSPVHICLCGDSISEGFNASAYVDAAPYMPPYPNLVAEGLGKIYNTPVTLSNFAVAGEASQHGVQVAGDIAKENPDLIVIAYGMNDANGGDVEDYKDNISQIIDITRKDNPDVEYILVAPMLGNPEWQNTPSEVFLDFRDALNSLCEAGTALADMTQVWLDLLKHKSYYDITGNGVNHPNDFGHRIYAQVLLELLIKN